MKQDILKILNIELQKAEDKIEEAKLHLDIIALNTWREYQKLVLSLIKKVQDQG